MRRLQPLWTGLLKYKLKRFDHVSVERVCSGIGMPYIYEYLRNIEQIPENPKIAQLIAHAPDHTAVITDSAFDQDSSWNGSRFTSFSIALRWLDLPHTGWRDLRRNHRNVP